MNPVELLHCPVPAACQICGQEVTESMFAFGHRRGEYRCASEVRIFVDETVEWDLRGEPANDACFIIDHWSAHYRCGSRLDVATDGTVTWDLRVHQPGTIEYENTRHYRRRI